MNGIQVINICTNHGRDMLINEKTKIMARLHTGPNNRGLSIYNPYFEETKTNALYILFHNPDVSPLVKGMKSLNISGAIPAGFEHDPKLITLMDDIDPIAQKIGRVTLIRQRDGKITGFHQAGYGLLESLKQISNPEDRTIVIMGAGNVVRSLLYYMRQEKIKPREIHIYNRTLNRAELVGKEFSEITSIKPLNELVKARGDIFINATAVGSPWRQGDDYNFSEKFISGFEAVVDVTFVPLQPQLVSAAEKLGKKVSPGWKMFLYQGKMCLEKILDIKVNEDILAQKIVTDFKTNWS